MSGVAEAVPFLVLSANVVVLDGSVRLARDPGETEWVQWHMHEGWEWHAYWQMRESADRPETRFPALHLTKGGLEDLVSCLCVMDLALGRWRYLLRRARYVARTDNERLSFSEFPQPPMYRLTARRAADLSTLLHQLRRGKHEQVRRRQVAVRRWHAATSTAIGIDSVMHGIAALEGLLLTGTGDMRLRLAVRAAATCPRRDRATVFRRVYAAYRTRSDYAHGSKLPTVSVVQQSQFLESVTKVVRAALSPGLPSGECLDARIIPWMRSLD